MRVLVVGTVPPPGGRAARELAAVVSDRIEAGDDVEVLSPDARSAAHHTADLRAILLPLRLLLLSSGRDALELRIEPDLPLGEHTGRAMRAATLFGLGIAFGMYSEVTLRLDSPIPLPGGVGGRATNDLWRRATRIVVKNEHDRDRVLLAPGVNPESVEIAAPISDDLRRIEESWPVSTESDLRERVQDGIRRRAQAERRANRARVDLGADSVGPLATEAFSASSRVRPNSSVVARAVVLRVLREIVTRAGVTRDTTG